MIGSDVALGDCLEMTKQPFLAWFIVIGRDEQRAVDAEFLGQLRVGDRVLRSI